MYLIRISEKKVLGARPKNELVKAFPCRCGSAGKKGN